MSDVIRHYSVRLALVALLCIPGMGCDRGLEEDEVRPLEAGLWGSEQALLEITTLGGEITFACAAGTLEARILVDNDGAFEVNGAMVAGPLATPVRPARYQGRIAGNTLTLAIRYIDTLEEFGVFELTRGLDSNVGYICVC